MFVPIPVTSFTHVFRSIPIAQLLILLRKCMVCDVNYDTTYCEIIAPKHNGATFPGPEIIANILTCSPIRSPVGRPLPESPDQWIPESCTIIEEFNLLRRCPWPMQGSRFPPSFFLYGSSRALLPDVYVCSRAICDHNSFSLTLLFLLGQPAHTSCF
jgi:hypothetical protein